MDVCHRDVHENNRINAVARRCASAHMVNLRMSKDHDFITTEGLGIRAPPNCDNCKNCVNCKFEAQKLSREEQRELEAIRNCIKLDPIKQVWTASYPCKQDPAILQNNESQAKSLALKTEKRLLKDPSLLDQYNQQFDDLVKRGVLVEIPKEEQESYDGPVYYVSHHEVFKPGSSSTPLRIVINSSLQFHGNSPNSVWIKGPNSLIDMFGVLLRFRTHKVALVGDIKKMYTQIRTTPREKHMRRVLWRFGNTDEDFIVYGVDRVMFGDRPAAAISAVVIRQTAEIYRSINEEAAAVSYTHLTLPTICSV